MLYISIALHRTEQTLSISDYTVNKQLNLKIDITANSEHDSQNFWGEIKNIALSGINIKQRIVLLNNLATVCCK